MADRDGGKIVALPAQPKSSPKSGRPRDLVLRPGPILLFLLAGLGLEALLLLSVNHLLLFVHETPWRDRMILLGLSLGYVVLTAQVVRGFWEMSLVAAMSGVVLGAMWAWLAAVAGVAFLVFLVGFAVVMELYLPIRGVAFLIEGLISRSGLSGRGPLGSRS